jgi:CelD/BcsL family acetyltransferase involved in cellulose biosynthesis
MRVEAMPALEIEEITTTGALEQLRPEWSALWARCPTATPFQSPEWLIPWWRHIAEGELWTLALRDEGRLVGLAPLYIYVRPGLAQRQVFLVGIATSDYLDAVFEDAYASCGAAAVLGHLDAARHRWDVCDWQELRSVSPLLHTAIPEGWRDEVTPQGACLILRLPATVEELRGTLPPRLFRNLRYYWHRAERAGVVRVERASEENLDDLLESLFQVHGARWTARGGAGVVAPEAVRQAHRQAAPALLSRGVLRLYGLRLDDRIVASLYGFTHAAAAETRAYAYLSGFDPAFERLSPGTLIMGHAVHEAIREGAAEFDFLRGREPYKYLWGAKDHLVYRRRLWHTAGND